MPMYSTAMNIVMSLHHLVVAGVYRLDRQQADARPREYYLKGDGIDHMQGSKDRESGQNRDGRVG